MSCALLTSGATRTRVITWNTGATSTFEFTSVVVAVGDVIETTRTGSITAGKFDGSAAIEEVEGTADLAECDGDGVSSYDGDMALTITHL